MFARLASLSRPVSRTLLQTSSFRTWLPVFSVSSRLFRSTQPPITPDSDMNQDIIDWIKEDHNLVRQLFKEYQATTDPDTRYNTAKQIIKNLAVHSYCEEHALYPQYDQLLKTNGQAAKDTSFAEHQALKDALYALEQMSQADQQFDTKLTQVFNLFDSHATTHEEGQLLVELARDVPKDRLVQLGQTFQALKKEAPTRPHPLAPTGNVMGRMAGMGSKPLDEMKDKMEGVK